MGSNNGSARPVKAFPLETRFSFDSDRSATRGYVAINVANENLMSFLAVLNSFHVSIFNRFENTLISYRPHRL
jgi:hypothetical protein